MEKFKHFKFRFFIYKTNFNEKDLLSEKVLNYSILLFDIKCRVNKNSIIKLGENLVTINKRGFYGITLEN